MAYTVPTAADFKTRFDRDFPFAAADQTDMEKVRDTDIDRALTQAGVNFNDALWSSQAVFSEARLLVAAHFLCVNLLNSSQGLGGTAQWLTASKSVGNVAESFAIPERISRSPSLSIYSKTTYGMTYLSLLAPLINGNVACVDGGTTA